MNRILFAFLTLAFSSQLFADCSEFALHGDWTVFYQDNSKPDSFIEPGSVFEIRYDKSQDQFLVKLNDKNYKDKHNSWTNSCRTGKVYITGTIEKKDGSESHGLEMSRVTEVSDLLPRSPSVTNLDQISIRLPEAQANHGEEGAPIAQQEGSRPAADPGHMHADR